MKRSIVNRGIYDLLFTFFHILRVGVLEIEKTEIWKQSAD